MKIGEVIRTHRKLKNMTQEEMARYLGVTAPAVNKWENGNSLPDIMLLAPIARLLGISLDTLLLFHEELTDEEIRGMVETINDRLKSEPYAEVFSWGKKQIETYPGCDRLIMGLTPILDFMRYDMAEADTAGYGEYISGWYRRVLNSGDEDLREEAASALYTFYLRAEEYEEAEQYLVYFSRHSPEKKQKQAYIYSKTGRVREAHLSYEELLFGMYQTINLVFHSMYMLALEENNLEQAGLLVQKQADLAGIFEMGPYYETSPQLELAVVKKDADLTVETMKQMLAALDDMCAFSHSSLYKHMTFKPIRPDFLNDMKKNLIAHFQDEETFGYLKADDRWQKLVKSAVFD